MEKEFIELIQTFEKTATRLETLETTLLSFKKIVDGLRQNLDEVVEMVQLEEITELASQASLKLETLNQNMDVLMKTNLPQQAGQVVTTPSTIYYIEEKTHQLMIIETKPGGYKGAVENFFAKKLIRENQTVFALHENGDVAIMNGRKEIIRYPLNATDVTAVGYHLYYLTNNDLMKHHLLTQTAETLLKDVNHFTLTNDSLVCQTVAGEKVMITV